ncbi:MAG: hypothetical protein HOY75_10945 [Streptomyces sp.]|nr:hypothetical protein [Streptomyces sp.]
MDVRGKRNIPMDVVPDARTAGERLGDRYDGWAVRAYAEQAEPAEPAEEEASRPPNGAATVATRARREGTAP